MSIKSLQNISLIGSLDYINNLFDEFREQKLLSIEENINLKNLNTYIDNLNKMTNSISDSINDSNKLEKLLIKIRKFEDQIKNIKLDELNNLSSQISDLQKLIKNKNFQNKLSQSKVLRILSELHDMEILEYKYFIIHSEPISWNNWDDYFDIMKATCKDINWSNYSDKQVLLCLFLWGAYLFPNQYNKNLDDNDLINFKNERHPTLLKNEDYILNDYHEVFICNKNIEDSEFKNEWKKAIEILNNDLGGKFDKIYQLDIITEKIKCNNKFKYKIKQFKARIPNLRGGYFGKYEFFITLDGFIKNNLDVPYDLIGKFNPDLVDYVKYCVDNKIAIIKYNKKTLKCCGLKPYDFNDFMRTEWSQNWITDYEKSHLHKFK